MAVRPEFLRERVMSDGPFLLHLCRSDQDRDRILSDGLIPGDQQPGGGRYDGPLTARPAHVYMCAPHAWRAIFYQCGRGPADQQPWVAIRAEQLAPARINPDEDCMFVSFICDDPVDLMGLPDPAVTVRDEWAGDTGDLASRPYRSYGEWAHAVNLGRIDRQTEQAWMTVGSLAYHGTIAPELLTAAAVTDDGIRTHLRTSTR